MDAILGTRAPADTATALEQPVQSALAPTKSERWDSSLTETIVVCMISIGLCGITLGFSNMGYLRRNHGNRVVMDVSVNLVVMLLLVVLEIFADRKMSQLMLERATNFFSPVTMSNKSMKFFYYTLTSHLGVATLLGLAYFYAGRLEKEKTNDSWFKSALVHDRASFLSAMCAVIVLLAVQFYRYKFVSSF